VSKRCFYCEKIPVSGNKISHSNIKTKTRYFPNLQRVRAFVDGVSRRVSICTRCLRSGFLTKPPVRAKQVAPEATAAPATA
jgi:large subunit ribosomal protein L28